MRIRRRSALLLGGLLVATPALASCAVARDTRKIADYFKDLPRVLSVKDWYNTADADDQVNIDLELEEDVSADDVDALFADAEPVLREATQFPVHVTASWSHHGVRMEKCGKVIYNVPTRYAAYDDSLRAGVEGAQTLASGTARTVECGRFTGEGDDTPALTYTVDHGSADTLPDDVALTLPQDLARDGYDVDLKQKVVLAGWEVNVTVSSREGAARSEGVPVDELVAALPQAEDDVLEAVHIGASEVLPEDVALGVTKGVSDEGEFVSLGVAVVRALKENGWRGVLQVRGLGVVVLDISTSPATVVSESETAGLGERILEQARA